MAEFVGEGIFIQFDAESRFGRQWDVAFDDLERLGDIAFAERGIWYIIRGFVVAPGISFEGFLGRDRARFSNPLKLVVFLSALAAFLMHQVPPELL